MLKITKIFNNNAILAQNELGVETVALGKGIGFGKKIDEYADAALIEKTFTLTKSPFAARLLEILGEIPSEYFRLTDQIVRHAQSALGCQFGQSVYVSLTDHLFHAVERSKKTTPQSALHFDLKRLYPQEYAVGQWAVAHIEQKLNQRLHEEEAGFIALHLFNARSDSDFQHTFPITQIIKDVLSLISYQFPNIINEESLDYARFLTHLQYFAKRLFAPQSALPETAPEDFLHTQTKIAYPQAYACVQKINHYLQNQHSKTLSPDEALYLTIHIQKLLRSP